MLSIFSKREITTGTGQTHNPDGKPRGKDQHAESHLCDVLLDGWVLAQAYVSIRPYKIFFIGAAIPLITNMKSRDAVQHNFMNSKY